jgi:hypothetical protein
MCDSMQMYNIITQCIHHLYHKLPFTVQQQQITVGPKRPYIDLRSVNYPKNNFLAMVIVFVRGMKLLEILTFCGSPSAGGYGVI